MCMSYISCNMTAEYNDQGKTYTVVVAAGVSVLFLSRGITINSVAMGAEFFETTKLRLTGACFSTEEILDVVAVRR